ncbi:MAG: signal peptidase I [Acidimicrobiales bacterium]|nr:signal peptidase I [Acidimicrobiales bacterium]
MPQAPSELVDEPQSDHPDTEILGDDIETLGDDIEILGDEAGDSAPDDPGEPEDPSPEESPRTGWATRAYRVGDRLLLTLSVLWSLGAVALAGCLVTAAVTDHRVEIVTTGSMSPTIRSGDVVVVRSLADAGMPEVGDVIAYQAPGRSQNVLHRVVDIVETPQGPRFITQGDANQAIDARPVRLSEITGELRFVVRDAGPLLEAAQPPAGYALLVGPPLIIGSLRWLIRRRLRDSDAQQRSPREPRAPETESAQPPEGDLEPG